MPGNSPFFVIPTKAGPWIRQVHCPEIGQKFSFPCGLKGRKWQHGCLLPAISVFARPSRPTAPGKPHGCVYVAPALPRQEKPIQRLVIRFKPTKTKIIMKLNLTLLGRVTQYKLVQVEGKPPFLDIKIDVVVTTTSGKEFTHWLTCKVWHELAVKTEPLLTKGCMVSVSGNPEIKPYSRRDGSPGAELIVHAEKIAVVKTITTPPDDED